MQLDVVVVDESREINFWLCLINIAPDPGLFYQSCGSSGCGFLFFLLASSIADCRSLSFFLLLALTR